MSKATKATKRDGPSHRWTDDEVAELLAAQMCIEHADDLSGSAGFEAFRKFSGEWLQARIRYVTAVSERYPLTRKRARFRRLAARILATPLDWTPASARRPAFR